MGATLAKQKTTENKFDETFLVARTIYPSVPTPLPSSSGNDRPSGCGTTARSIVLLKTIEPIRSTSVLTSSCSFVEVTILLPTKPL